MSLQVFSPHSHAHSNEPQSPFPCTPSTLCSSPIPHANNTIESDRSTSSSSSNSYFRTSHHRQRQRQISSPLCQLANAFQDHQRGRVSPVSHSPSITHSDNIDDEDTTIMHGSDHVHHREARTTRRRDDTSSVIDSPEMPMSIRSPSMSTLGGHHTPEEGGASRHDLFDSPRECFAASSPGSSQPTSGMRTHPSAASIPIILAGLNGMKALGRERERRELMHGKEMSGDTVASVDTEEEERVGGEVNTVESAMTVDQEEQRGSAGSIGLGILQDPIQLMDTRRISNTSSGGRNMHQYHASGQKELALPTSGIDMVEERNPPVALDAHRQDRADSWTSSLVSTDDDSLASSSSSSHRRPSTPDASLHLSSVSSAHGKLLPAQEVYASGHEHQAKYASRTMDERTEIPRHIEVLPVYSQLMRDSSQSEKENMHSPSQGSEFSISAYDYSPHIPQGETWAGVATVEEVEETLSKVAPIRRSRVASCTVTTTATVKDQATQSERQQTNEPPTPMSTKSSMKKKKKAPPTPSAEVSLDSPKVGTVKKRRRAVTIANPPEAHDASENLRRQSSPPTLSTARFATGSYATLSPAALVKKQYEATSHSPRGTDNMVRPSTSLAGTATPNRLGLGAPLSLRPSTAGAVSNASNSHISPAAVFKPLPALPTPKRPQEIPSPAPSSRNRSGFLSVQTSPRKTTFSRPGTASPAARSFGLVAPYTNLSPTYRDYRSLKSRESFSSLLNQDTKKNLDDKSGNTRSRSTSVSSRASTGKASKRGGATEILEKYTGPPRYISFAIDQESFREICPIFELVETMQQPVKLSSSSGSSSDSNNGTTNGSSYATTTTYRYLPIHTDQAYPFHHATLEPPPILRRLLIDKYEKYDFINKQSVLPIKNEGIYAVKGLSAANINKDNSVKGDYQPSWRFEYRVMDRVNLLGKPIPGEKNLIPMAFTCSPEVLDPANARKRKAMDVVYKTLSSKLEALRVGDLPPDCM